MKLIIKKLYQIVPFKRQIFSCIKFFWKPNENFYRHLHFTGVFKVKPAPAVSFKMYHYGFEVENSIFWCGVFDGWEKNSLMLWSELVKSSDVIFDIGANTGIYSLLAKSFNPRAVVYAIEPVERVFEKLAHNNKLNNYDIFCLEFGASNEDGVATIFDSPNNHSYSSTFHSEIFEGEDFIQTQVKVKKLKTFIKERKIEALNLMKIDVEGHEPEVLEGLGEYLEKFKPIILIEVLTREIGKKLEELLDKKNYIYFYIDEEKDGVVLQRVQSIEQRESRNYLICEESVAAELKLKFASHSEPYLKAL